MPIEPYQWYSRESLVSAPSYMAIRFQEVTLFRREHQDVVNYLGASILSLTDKTRYVDPFLLAKAAGESCAEVLGIAEKENLIQTVKLNGQRYEMITAGDVWHVKRKLPMPDFVAERYYPEVEKIASKLEADQLGGIVTITHEDNVAAGMMGLMDAFSKYEIPNAPAQGDSFLAYARFRIRGAILDEGRDLAFVPRSARVNQRRYESAYEMLTQKLEREPTTEELRVELGWKHRKMRSFLIDLPKSTTLFIEAMPDEQKNELSDLFNPSRHYGIDENLMETELGQIIQRMVADLPLHQREVAEQYYFGDRSLREVGIVMDISESRVCQIAAQVRSNIAKRLRFSYPEYVP